MNKKGGKHNESVRQLTLFDAIEFEQTGEFSFPEKNKNNIYINTMSYDSRTRKTNRKIV